MKNTRWLLPTLLLLTSLVIYPACGYRLTRTKNLRGIQSLGIPTFKNSTQRYRIEQMITSAVLEEFSARTNIPVNSKSSGVDAVLQGEIRSMSASPVTFGGDTFATAFIVTVQLSVRLVRAADGSVLWEDDSFLFRERYNLNTRTTDFFSEQTPALERLSTEFAASLAGTILNRQ
jgi:hypothetical protein